MATQSINRSNTLDDRSSTLQRLTGVLGNQVARIALGLPMVVFGAMHFAYTEGMSGIVPGWLPFPSFWVILTGIALIAAGASFISNRFVVWAGLGLALLMATFVMTVHLPGVFNEATMQMSMVSMLKDVAILGGALLIVGRAANA